MKYPISTAIGLFLGLNQVMAASLPVHRPQELVPNFGPDSIHREYIADQSINYQASTSSFSGTTSDPEQVALDFARSHLTNSDFIIHSSYKSDLNGVTHVHLRQKVNGLPVLNGNINVNVLPTGQVLSYGDSFTKSKVKIQKSYSRPSFFQQVQNGLTQIILGGSNNNNNNINNKEMDTRFTPSTTTVTNTEEYEFVKGTKVISPNEAVVALYGFVKPKLPNPSIASILTPDDLTPTQSFRPHDGDDDGSTVHFEGVPYTLNPVRARRAYVQQDNGDLALVWDIEMELEDNWYNGQVHAFDGSMVGLVDWVHQSGAPTAAYYNVVPFGANDPSDSLQQLVKNPYDTFASPEGWHSQGAYSKLKGGRQDQENLTFNVTVGNNVYAHTNPDGGYNWENNYRPKGDTGGDLGDALVFDYKANFDVDEPETYEDAAVTNLFYWCNTAHDLFHRYGFDEKAGNFQQDNLGRGRKNDDGEGDAVVANAQDGSGRNNANFATPPDGQHGKMRMYIWDQTHPMRDGDFESGIVIHEYTHGVSNRLTGGPKNSNCLGWGEAGGMGEGWGDFVATVIRMKPEYKRDIDFGMGDWANGGDGIRKYKYSTSESTNPSTYKIMDRFDYWGVHAKGEVWAEMLYEVYWNLVDKHGFTPDWFPPAPALTTNERGIPIMSEKDLIAAKNHIVSHGNTLALQLVMDGLKLQPCSPSFTDARDAILDADKALTGGANYCDIYTGFAKRGLGVKAKLAKQGWIEQRKEDFEVPSECQ